VLLQLLALWLLKKNEAAGVVLAFTTQAFTFYKTFLYQ